MNAMHLVRRALLPLLVLAACDDATGPGGTPPPQDQILFVRGHDQMSDIYRMNADGSQVDNLSRAQARYSDLRLSPDGTRVAFYSDRAGCYDIWAMDVDGGALVQLTGVVTYERCNYAPRWSPDGTKIAFYSSRDVTLGVGWEAYVMNADGTGVVNVGGNPGTDEGNSYDAVHGWSPDGRVVLHSNRDGTEATYLVDSDGAGLELLMEGYAHPYWTPDGSAMLYMTVGDDESHLYITSSVGGDALALSPGGSHDYVPGWTANPWSPEGTHVAFVSDRSGDQDIWVAAGDGPGLVNVTNYPGHDIFLGWSPDGEQILFSSDRTGDADLYLVNRNGTGLVNLTNHPDVGDTRGIWVPRK